MSARVRTGARVRSLCAVVARALPLITLVAGSAAYNQGADPVDFFGGGGACASYDGDGEPATAAESQLGSLSAESTRSLPTRGTSGCAKWTRQASFLLLSAAARARQTLYATRNRRLSVATEGLQHRQRFASYGNRHCVRCERGDVHRGSLQFLHSCRRAADRHHNDVCRIAKWTLSTSCQQRGRRRVRLYGIHRIDAVSQTVTTVAGTGMYVSSRDGISASSAALVPKRVACDSI